MTAGNASPISDGAAAVAIVPEHVRAGLGLPGLRLVGGLTRGCDPRLPGWGAVPAVRELLDRTGRDLDDLAAIELVEAFAAQVLAFTDALSCPTTTLASAQTAAPWPWATRGASGAVSVVRLFSRLVRSGRRPVRWGSPRRPWAAGWAWPGCSRWSDERGRMQDAAVGPPTTAGTPPEVGCVVGLEDVHVRLGDRDVLRGVSAELRERRIGIVGANGSGKSTLARLLNGLVLPTRGAVRVDGLDTRRAGAQVRRRVGFMFSDPDAQIVMPTVAEDVAYSLRRSEHDRPTRDRLVADWLARHGLAGHADHPAHLLSGAEAAARAHVGARERATPGRGRRADDPARPPQHASRRRAARGDPAAGRAGLARPRPHGGLRPRARDRRGTGRGRRRARPGRRVLPPPHGRPAVTREGAVAATDEPTSPAGSAPTSTARGATTYAAGAYVVGHSLLHRAPAGPQLAALMFCSLALLLVRTPLGVGVAGSRSPGSTRSRASGGAPHGVRCGPARVPARPVRAPVVAHGPDVRRGPQHAAPGARGARGPRDVHDQGQRPARGDRARPHPASRVGVDVERVALVLALALRSVPVIANLASRVRDAQRARGTSGTCGRSRCRSWWGRCGRRTLWARRCGHAGSTTEAPQPRRCSNHSITARPCWRWNARRVGMFCGAGWRAASKKYPRVPRGTRRRARA
ncbi:ATP-binding cassette domain-containing protein [Oerskovia sp. M15]